MGILLACWRTDRTSLAHPAPRCLADPTISPSEDNEREPGIEEGRSMTPENRPHASHRVVLADPRSSRTLATGWCAPTRMLVRELAHERVTGPNLCDESAATRAAPMRRSRGLPVGLCPAVQHPMQALR
jgi:hypothetical protein